MAVNLIVLAVTLLMAAFLFSWAFFPRLRPWMEAPKYRMLAWHERFPDAVRPGADEGNIEPQRSPKTQK